MKYNIMKKWTKALRSGEYEQGKGQLVDDKDRFCCLGVLCNLAVDEDIGEWKDKGQYYVFLDKQKNAREDDLSVLVQKWAGINSSQVYFGDKENPYSTLIYLNDDGNKTFEEIADIIELNYKEL